MDSEKAIFLVLTCSSSRACRLIYVFLRQIGNLSCKMLLNKQIISTISDPVGFKKFVKCDHSVWPSSAQST